MDHEFGEDRLSKRNVLSFQIYPSTCKNHDSYYINPIDMILVLFNSLESLVLLFQISNFLGFKYGVMNFLR